MSSTAPPSHLVSASSSIDPQARTCKPSQDVRLASQDVRLASQELRQSPRTPPAAHADPLIHTHKTS